MKRRPIAVALLLSALLLCLPGCVTPTIPGASAKLLDFLQIGATTRQETIVKLGQPSASFESESILTYRVGHEAKQGYYVISPKAMLPWQNVRFSLVLVFDGNGILQKKNMVDVQ